MKSQKQRGATTTESRGVSHVERTRDLHNQKLKKEMQEQGGTTTTKLRGASHAKTTQGVAQSKVGK